MSRLFHRTVAYATILAGLFAGPAFADQILETHNASLTTYVPTSKSCCPSRNARTNLT